MSSKKILKRLFLLIILVIGVAIVFNFDLVVYGVNQAKGQLSIVNDAVPIEKVLANTSVPDSLKYKIRLIQEIRAFAFNELGLKENDNYTTFYNQHGRQLMFVVEASEPFELKAMEWHFPILGTFSYRGYFNENSATKEAQRLDSAGYDVRIRNAGGWSTLGWLTDPILSGMLSRDEPLLAELIIHELTHGTLFVKDSLQFNENLATFVGVEGAKRYLTAKYGKDSDILKRYLNHLRDKEILQQYVLDETLRLQKFYGTMPDTLSIFDRNEQKKKFFKLFVNGVKDLPLHHKNRYLNYYQSEALNNAFFLGYLRYTGDIPILRKMLVEKYDSNLSNMVNDLKKKHQSL